MERADLVVCVSTNRPLALLLVHCLFVEHVSVVNVSVRKNKRTTIDCDKDDIGTKKTDESAEDVIVRLLPSKSVP